MSGATKLNWISREIIGATKMVIVVRGSDSDSVPNTNTLKLDPEVAASVAAPTVLMVHIPLLFELGSPLFLDR